MPIYEYSCKKCGHGFEVLIRNDSDLPKKCPSCGTLKPAKTLSAFAVASDDPCGKCPSSDAGCPSAGGGCCGM